MTGAPELLEALVRSSVDGLFAVDRELRYTLWNPAMERFSGVPRDEVLGRCCLDLFPHIRELGVDRAIRAALEGVDTTLADLAYPHPTGRLVRYEGHYSPLRDRSGAIVGVLAIVRDVTERHAAETALREREELFRSAVENGSDPVVILDERGRATYVNPATERLLGRTREDLIGRTSADFSNPEDVPAVWAGRARALASPGTQVRVEARWRSADGEWHHLDATQRAFRDRDGALRVIVNARDLTETKRAQAALMRRTAELDAVFLALRDRCLRLDGEGRIVTLLAGPADEMIVDPVMAVGKRPQDLLDPESAASVEAAWRTMQTTREPTSVEWSATTARGRQYFETRFVPFLDDESISVIRNVTDRRRAEEALREREDRMRASQKMEALGRLAGGVAHDFNNLLTVILGCSTLLARSLGAPNAYLDEITRAAERATALTGQLLALSRKQVMVPRVVDPNAVVSDVQQMLRRLIGEDIELVTDLSTDVGRVNVDPGQLEQVLLNLVLNARDAVAERGGRIVVSTATADLDAQTARARDGAEAGRYVVLAVEDDGAGMDDAVVEHLFEPFFTTKPRGRGTGLGLATVYGIVKQSGGHVVVKTARGRGSRFEVHLPRVEAQTADASTPSLASMPRGTERVLLVEDEAPLRRLVAEILRECGYDVVAASGPEEALRWCEEHDTAADLLLTDVVMPGMSGRDLASRVVARWPGARVLLMSGYDQDAVAAHGGDRSALLAKPFTASSLARRVRDVLDAEGRGEAG